MVETVAPETQEALDALNAEARRRLAQLVAPRTLWGRWMPAVVAVGGMTAGAALFAAGMVVASRTPTGWYVTGGRWGCWR